MESCAVPGFGALEMLFLVVYIRLPEHHRVSLLPGGKSANVLLFWM